MDQLEEEPVDPFVVGQFRVEGTQQYTPVPHQNRILAVAREEFPSTEVAREGLELPL